MAINFPDSPTVGATYTVGNITWQWNGTTWTSTGSNAASELALKAPIASPTFTGTVTTPLSTAGYVKTSSGGVLSSSAAIAQADVTNLTSDLAGKAATSHTHTKSQITDFAHTHAQSDVTNLASDLAAKAPTASPTFTGNVTMATLDIVGGSMNTAADWPTAQLEIQSSSTGNPGLAMHAPGASTANLWHPRGTQTMQVSGNAGYIDTGAKSIRNMFVSTGDPSGGVDGDVWLKYTP